MSFFGAKSSPMLGLDISSTAVKLLELQETGGSGQYRVESYAVEPMPSNAVVDQNIADVELVGSAIESVVKSSGTKLKQAAVAVSGSAVITKIITMPASLSDSEMESQIELEADQYIPYPLDEVNTDFEVLGVNEKNAELVDVLLAASRSENVEDRVAALDYAGITPKVVDVEAYAMENAFTLLADQLPNQGIEQTIAIADIGSSTTTLSVLHDGKIIPDYPHGSAMLNNR
ncbi:MAG: pilus assembly protein PilM [gamma proteobacterium symbiont of Bathyaustriella thionipta]|nr:pilus assembly protein PilM [gamma proteobacterium symbiont of Bathyaustriella thionipta]